MSKTSVSRRALLAGAAAAVGAAALPLSPLSVVGPPMQVAAPSIEFFRYGISLDGGPTMFAVYEQLADGVIRISEDEFGPGEILSLWANGLGQFFNISKPAADYYVYVREEPEEGAEDDWDEVVFEEPQYTPAFFEIAPGHEHYDAVRQALAEAEGWRFQPYPEASVKDESISDQDED